MKKNIFVLTKDKRLFAKIEEMLSYHKCLLKEELVEVFLIFEALPNNFIFIVDLRNEANYYYFEEIKKLNLSNNRYIFITKEIFEIEEGFNLILEKDLSSQLESLVEGAFWVKEDYHKQTISLKEKVAIIDTIYRKGNIGIIIIDRDQELFQMFNHVFTDFVKRSEEEIISIGWEAITHPDDIKIEKDYYNDLELGIFKNFTWEKRFVLPDGKLVWANTMATVISKGVDNHYTLVMLVEDITEKKRLQHQFYESEREKAILLTSLPGLVFKALNDENWTMTYVSHGCFSLTGYLPKDLINNETIAYVDLILPEFQEYVRVAWEKAIHDRKALNIEYQIITKNGEIRWVSEYGEAFFDYSSELVFLEGIIIDITKQKETEKILNYKTRYDENTNLLNRTILENVLKRFIAKKRKGHALVVINMPEIYSLISRFGYDYILNVIRKIASALKAVSSAKKLLYYGGDRRFIFHINGYQNQEELISFYDKIYNNIIKILLVERINAGVGIVEIDDNYNNPDEIFKDALLATEKALASERILNYAFFDQKIKAKIERETKLLKELNNFKNMEENLFLMFQPILKMDNEEVVMFEALARFNSKDYNLVSPFEFIPILEKSKLIIPYSYKIIEMGLAFIKEVHQVKADVSLSINISFIHFMEEHFIIKLLDLINEANVSPKHIVLELTESVFEDNIIQINEKLEILRDKGFTIAIDDFGTGFSSLAKLRSLNKDYVKLDKSFTDQLLDFEIEDLISQDIISMSKRLKTKIIAEGVEKKEQLEILKMFNCDYAQGYYFSKPLLKEEALLYFKSKLN